MSDLFDEDDYVRVSLKRSARPSAEPSAAPWLVPQTEAEFFVSHKLRYRRKPEEWAVVVGILRIYPGDRLRLVRLIEGMEAETDS